MTFKSTFRAMSPTITSMPRTGPDINALIAPTDAYVRIYAEYLSEQFGQRFIVENIPGAASNNAAATAAKAEPDSYTLYVATNANSTSVTLYKNLRYKFPDDFAPIGLLVTSPPVLSVSNGLGVNSVQELVAAASFLDVCNC